MTAVLNLLRAIWRSIKIIQSVLGTLIFVVFLILVINLFFLDSKPEVPDGAALVLDVRGLVVEQKRARDPFVALLGGRQKQTPEVEMREIQRAISKAKSDKRISVLVLRLDSMIGAGPSQLQEIGAMIDDFKTSGKQVLAYGDYYSQSQYLVASHADKVYMNPGGALLLSGYGIYPMYVKAGLDLIKAKVHVFRVGEYKTAGEPYLREDMSPEAKEANLALLNDLWQAYLTEVAVNRPLTADELAAAIENQDGLLREEKGSFGKLALRMELIDELKTRDAWQASMRKIVGRNGVHRGYKNITMKNYLEALGVEKNQPNQIAVVVVSGVITDGERPKGVAGGDTIARQLRKARKDKSVKGVVLRVDSPGGSAFASEKIRREVELIQLQGKPVVVSMGGAAASGGYWVSLASDEIWASPTTITGSIGIVAIIPTFEGTLKKIGINVDGVGTTKFSGAFNPARGLSEPIKDIISQSIEEGYKQFVAHVANSRGLTYEAVDAIARGRVWSGAAAKELGLIDHLGGFNDAVASAAEKAGLTTYSVRYVEDPPTFEESLAEFLEEDAELPSGMIANTQSATVALLARLDRELKEFLTLNDPLSIFALCMACRLTF